MKTEDHLNPNPRILKWFPWLEKSSPVRLLVITLGSIILAETIIHGGLYFWRLKPAYLVPFIDTIVELLLIFPFLYWLMFKPLVSQIQIKKQYENSLLQARNELEIRVGERTSELTQANAALRSEIQVRQQTEERMRMQSAALEAAANAIVITDRAGTIEWVNPAFTRMTGYEREEVIGKGILILKSGAHPADFYAEMWNTVLSGKVWQGEITNRRKDGTLYVEEQTITPQMDGEGNVIGFISIKQDISHRKKSEEVEKQIRAQLQALSRRLVEVQENERRAIARELHDEVSQALTYLKVAMDLLKEEAANPEAVIAGVADLEKMVDEVLGNLHTLAVALRPASLDHLGLVPAIRQYSEAIREKSGITMILETGLLEKRLPANLEISLYRIIQEGLNNIVRHAHASRAEVVLQQNKEYIRITIRDNGVGFEQGITQRADRLGLFGMRERVVMVGGKMDISSTPGEGTCISVEVPYGT